MGIFDWWKRLMQREDQEAIESEIEREGETRDEQRFRDYTGYENDERAAETLSVHSESIEDAERLAEGDDE
jgi:hypothetical protein